MKSKNDKEDCKPGSKKVANKIKINPPIKESRLSMTEYFRLKEENGDAFPDLLEALTVAQRIKRGNGLKRREAVMASARKRALARHADKGRLENRSRKDAIGTMKQKYAGGQKVADLSYGDKARIEDILKTKKGAVSNLSRKLLNKVRERENARHSNKSHNKGD